VESERSSSERVRSQLILLAGERTVGKRRGKERSERMWRV